eukprot:CAMPEP_0202834522 /NCGR_PEP_ID=MMETSP1389-20130828/32514_1 /ASSEMBLY_ACC=CAM_ASM_000865 /TAXON_ID=302021 /ORGANISM="Rhodomonas sp., Strain CCMP768" /LENGTH=99 /DNA_ID=CAMNT_0049509737 /DNA_START=89 /DNA_END=386 /DNA_ORIENTATION=+
MWQDQSSSSDVTAVACTLLPLSHIAVALPSSSGHAGGGGATAEDDHIAALGLVCGVDAPHFERDLTFGLPEDQIGDLVEWEVADGHSVDAVDDVVGRDQ